MRALDLMILLPHRKLLRVYFRTWKGEYTQSPFTENSFEKVHQARRQGRSTKEFTYGETPVISARAFLKEAGVNQASCVYDVGAGRGRVLIASRLLGAKSLGCDLLDAHVRTAGPELAKIHIDLLHLDATEASFHDVTHVFVAWTCFTYNSRKQLSEHFTSMSAGTRLLLLDHPLKNRSFTKLYQKKIWCSWGRATLYVYERNATAQ